MAVVDPFVSLRDWRSLLYRGDPAVVDRFLDGIDATLSPGWVRDREYERTRSRRTGPHPLLHVRPGGGCGGAGVAPAGDCNPSARRPGPGAPPSALGRRGADRIGRLVAEFADGCVLPAARAAGVRCTRPAFGLRSAVTPAAEMLFTRFADTADGEWLATHGADTRVVGRARLRLPGRAEVAIDRAELGRWLADSGWEQEAVTALAERFFADSEWLARRLAVMAP